MQFIVRLVLRDIALVKQHCVCNTFCKLFVHLAFKHM